MTTTGPHHTPLHPFHVDAGATMVERDGWLLPEHFGDGDAELQGIRTRAGVLDAGHTGRIRIRGGGALALLGRHCTADVDHQNDNTSVTTDVCDAAGRPITGARLIRLETFWVLATPAGPRKDVLAALTESADELDARVDDQTFKTTTLTVAGPDAPAILDAILPEKASALDVGDVRSGSLMLARYIAVRTDALGLWTMDVMLPNMLVGQAWKFITAKAGENCLPPIGLAAQDALLSSAG